MHYHWNWGVFLQPAASGGGTYLGWMIRGLEVTVSLSVTSWIIALVVGTIMGVLRTVPSRLARGIATAYVEIFRDIPLLVQLFIWYFVAPELVPVAWGDWMKQQNPGTQQYLASMFCLGLFTGARICEQVRSGINSLARGQKSAALALKEALQAG